LIFWHLFGDNFTIGVSMDEAIPTIMPEEIFFDNSAKDIFEELAADRILFLKGEITGNSSTDLIANIILLDKIATEEIVIYINSPGGELGSMMSIYDVFQSVQSPIRTVCIGGAYSAAAVLLASGSRGMRMAYPRSKMMIHDIQLAELSGSKSEIEKESRLIKQDSLSMLEIIACHTGQSLRKVKGDCKNDKYFTPQKALQYGLIDEIIKYRKEIPLLRKT
jgi:ATP-dependent Clp protease protease subunit